jgi:hypothetical protein
MLPGFISVRSKPTDRFNVVVLSSMHTNEGDELQRDLHMSSTTEAAERGSDDRMCQLWVSRLFFC